MVQEAGDYLMAKCVHHWLLEPPTGEMSRGLCRKCGARDVFQNVLVEGGTEWPLAKKARMKRLQFEKNKLSKEVGGKKE